MPDPSLATSPTRSTDEVRKFPCKQCGAGLTFAPGQSVLECPYCGYREEVPVTPQAIQEYDLDLALSQIPHQEGWGTERRTLRCENCGATTTFAPGQVAGECAFCGSKKVVEEATSQQLIRPESLVPFTVKREEAVKLFRDWISRLWFRPNNLKHAGQLAKITGTYLPFWTYDAFTSSYWTAEAGYHYYETEYYTETDSNGNTVQRTRQVQRTRWVPASGSRQDFFDDELVCASRGLPPKLISGICPYKLENLIPYEAAFLAGFVAEEYQIGLDEGWQMAQAAMQREVEARCGHDVPGDTHRFLQVQTAYSHKSFKHLLLPVWIAAYLYNGESYRFLVNGQTGKTSGEAPLSWWKIAGAVLLVLIVVAIILLIVRAREGASHGLIDMGLLWLRQGALMAGVLPV